MLSALFGNVVIPQTVFSELEHPNTPSKVRQWIGQAPTWLVVHAVVSISNPVLMRLDRGEREAIQLALDLGVDTVLMDEADGRQIAEAFHLEVRGTMGILERGARLGKTDFRQALGKLDQTNFRLSREVREAFLRRNP